MTDSKQIWVVDKKSQFIWSGLSWMDACMHACDRISISATPKKKGLAARDYITSTYKIS